eukprot:TRINITY_DN1783_c1_g1_i1.p1 TRINITY_DN1783_c1_g1~~TRINITY_DN1783_c1_g1_i1.p1  ORF type:complete len:414 (-),score=80.83 TRINITY_DN1783_c1_g1_i1:74-1315(-)
METFTRLQNIVKKLSTSHISDEDIKGTIEDIPTPANIINLKKFIQNCDFIIESAKKNNLSLRPMIKTHRCIEGALLQLYGSDLPNVTYEAFQEHAKITVATMVEAEFYALNGFQNILYPYAMTIDKLKRAQVIASRIRSFGVTVDNIEVLENVIEFTKENGVRFFCFVDVNPDYHRTGVNYDDDKSVELVQRVLECPNLDFEGIYLHAGQSYGSATADEITGYANLERDIAVGFANKLRESGIEVRHVAVGSTPTVSKPGSLDGISEMHPGNYVFYDVHQIKIGSSVEENISNSVLARILTKHKGSHPRLIIDAGALSLSKDAGPKHLGYEQWGVIENHPELRITSISQELGVIEGTSETPLDPDLYDIGTLLKVYPNHSCLSSYNFSQYYILDNDQVIDQWDICPRHGSFLM